jgi:hypothetical protein
MSPRSASWDGVNRDEGACHHRAVERLGDPGRSVWGTRGCEGLRLEYARGRAQLVLHRSDAVVELRGPRLAPQRHFGLPMVEGLVHHLLDAQVVREKVRSDRYGLWRRTAVQ